MGRRKKLNVDLKNIDSLQELMQEVYYDSCSQIKDAQNTITNLVNSVEPLDTDEFTKVAKAKTDALKIKDSAIKIKLDVGKLQNDILKRIEEGNVKGSGEETKQNNNGGNPDLEDYSRLWDMVKNEKNENGD